MAKVTKKVKDEEGTEYEIEYEEDDKKDDDDDDDDEDEENIYLTERDLRWLKEQRKKSAASESSKDQIKEKVKPKSGIAVKKKKSETSSNQQGTQRAKRLSLR